MIASCLAAVAWLLLAPNELSAVRLFGVSLAWWGALGAGAAGVAAFLSGLRGDAPTDPA